MKTKTFLPILLAFLSIIFLASTVSAACPPGAYCTVNTFLEFTDHLGVDSLEVYIGDTVNLEIISISYNTPLTSEELKSGSAQIVKRYSPGSYLSSGYFFSNSRLDIEV